MMTRGQKQLRDEGFVQILCGACGATGDKVCPDCEGERTFEGQPCRLCWSEEEERSMGKVPCEFCGGLGWKMKRQPLAVQKSLL